VNALRKLKSFALFVFCACTIIAACRASATAATEFCPAKLTNVYQKSRGDATVYSYYLQALASRIAEGTIVAQTDAGWFTWVQQPIQLSRTTYTSTSPSVTFSYHVAASPELTVVFPRPVAIWHAWVATARAQGDHLLNWDKRGTVTCEPVDFAPGKYQDETQTHTPQAGDETPAPAPPPARAIASGAPFQLVNCAQPFASAAAIHAVEPEFPRSVASQGFNAVATSEIAVAIDPEGNLVDAWVWATSGYPALDDAAINAARRSKFSGATSYCRPVSGTYIFRASFAQ